MFSCFVDLPQMPTAFYYWVTIKQADNRTTILQLSVLSSLDSLSVSVNVHLYATILERPAAVELSASGTVEPMPITFLTCEEDTPSIFI